MADTVVQVGSTIGVLFGIITQKGSETVDLTKNIVEDVGESSGHLLESITGDVENVLHTKKIGSSVFLGLVVLVILVLGKLKK